MAPLSPTTLHIPHAFREWADGDGNNHCTLTAELPNGTKRSFAGHGPTPRSARLYANMMASYAVKTADLGESTESSDEPRNPAEPDMSPLVDQDSDEEEDRLPLVVVRDQVRHAQNGSLSPPPSPSPPSPSPSPPSPSPSPSPPSSSSPSPFASASASASASPSSLSLPVLTSSQPSSAPTRSTQLPVRHSAHVSPVCSLPRPIQETIQETSSRPVRADRPSPAVSSGVAQKRKRSSPSSASPAPDVPKWMQVSAGLPAHHRGIHPLTSKRRRARHSMPVGVALPPRSPARHRSSSPNLGKWGGLPSAADADGGANSVPILEMRKQGGLRGELEVEQGLRLEPEAAIAEKGKSWSRRELFEAGKARDVASGGVENGSMYSRSGPALPFGSRNDVSTRARVNDNGLLMNGMNVGGAMFSQGVHCGRPVPPPLLPPHMPGGVPPNFAMTNMGMPPLLPNGQMFLPPGTTSLPFPGFPPLSVLQDRAPHGYPSAMPPPMPPMPPMPHGHFTPLAVPEKERANIPLVSPPEMLPDLRFLQQPGKVGMTAQKVKEMAEKMAEWHLQQERAQTLSMPENAGVGKMPRWYGKPRARKGLGEGGMRANFSPPQRKSFRRDGESSDEEDDGSDYVSSLNMLAQKGRVCKDLHLKLDKSVSAPKGRWRCEAKVTLVDPKGTDDVVVLKTVFARSKKKAKKKAAKLLYLAVKDGCKEAVERDQKVTAGVRNGRKESSPTSMERPSGPCTAMSVLNQLYHRRKLKYVPATDFKELDGGSWRCTIVCETVDGVVLKLQQVGPQKKSAKNLAAQQAYDKLKELKLDGIEIYNNVLPIKAPKLVSDDEEEAEVDEGFMNSVVQISDDEVGAATKSGMEDDDVDECLSLPKEYEIVVASNTDDCRKWLNKHALTGSGLGLYLDSWVARDAFKKSDTLFRPKTLSHVDALSNPVLCFSSDASALVIRACMFTPKDAHDRLRRMGAFWVPKVVESTLRNSKIPKYTYNADEELMEFYSEHGIHIMGIEDISALSYAAVGMNSATDKILWPMTDLMRYWLEKDTVGSTWAEVWPSSENVPQMMREDEEITAQAVMNAYACVRITDKVHQAVLRKTAQFHSHGPEFEELCGRLMQSPCEG